LDKEEALERIIEKIGGRKLVWFGDIGQDSRGLLDLPQYSHCYCSVAAPDSAGLQTLSLEDLTGKRPLEGEMPPLTGPLSEQAFAWLESAIGEPCLVMNRTPLSIMPLIQAMSSKVEYLGNSYKTYRALSDKVAVEAALQDVPGLKVIPYVQVANDASRREVLLRKLKDGPLVLRRSGLSAGIGHELIRDEEKLATSSLAGIEESISVGPYLEEFYTVGVGACVFPDGGITQHLPLAVLSGHPLFGPFDFSWGGNDFGVAAKLSPDALETVEAAVQSVGTWLHGQGYVGIFGFQAMVNEEECYYLEINARFGGKSRVSVELDDALDQPNVLLDHLMAWLGIESYKTRPLAEQAAIQRPYSHILCRNRTGKRVRLKTGGMRLPESFFADLLPREGMWVDPDAILCAVRSPESVMTAPWTLNGSAIRAVEAAIACFEPEEPEFEAGEEEATGTVPHDV
jgi:hypothetical protein